VRSLVVGGAGFIGSHLVERLALGGPVTVFDDLSVGRREHLEEAHRLGEVRLVVGDARELSELVAAAPEHDVLFHLAANPEARWGLERPRLDLELGTIATWNALEAARRCGIPRFVLASSGTVYGEAPGASHEHELGALPISLYGASKLAGEAMLSAYVECFGLSGCILRFGNVVGPRGTHGAALDFLKKLRASRGAELEVLGDGNQRKPYLHVDDCVKGLLFALEHTREPLGIYNLAPPDETSVSTIAELCVAASPYPRAPIRYTGGERGWPGDVPRSRLDPSKLAELGFRVGSTSDAAVRRAIAELAREVFGAEPGS
jgi:UDP-glucose 4-epimerase